MKKIKIKNVLIIMLVAIEIVATYFMYKSGTNKEVVLDNVELKELTDSNSFAIYLDGKEYTSSTTWPASAMFQKAECQNEKGDKVDGVLTFNESENKAYVSNVTQTLYCYLYFTTDTTSPTCSLKLDSNSNLVWNTKSDDKTTVTNLKYILTSSSSEPYAFTNNTSLTISSVGTYYGYVKDEVGNVGQCAIDVKNKTGAACTASPIDYFTNCTYANYYCSGGQISAGPMADNTTGCNGSTSASTYASICPSNPSGSYNTCSCTKSTWYSCSNGNNYPTSSACTSLTCGSTCPAGYTETAKYCYKPGEGTTTPDPGGQNPTCSFNVTTSGVTLVPSNATSWYLSTSQTSSPSYGTGSTTSALGEHTYYGYVKNSNGTTGTCQLEMYKATAHGCSVSSTTGGGQSCYSETCPCPNSSQAGQSCGAGGYVSSCPSNSGVSQCSSTHDTWYNNCSCTQIPTTYTCSNGSSCTTSGCCASMFCGSDNCSSGYTEINPNTYTRYCYK